jgi:hypothetical protein
MKRTRAQWETWMQEHGAVNPRAMQILDDWEEEQHTLVTTLMRVLCKIKCDALVVFLEHVQSIVHDALTSTTFDTITRDQHEKELGVARAEIHALRERCKKLESQASVADEREACAKIVDESVATTREVGYIDIAEGLEDIAAAIRARWEGE